MEHTFLETLKSPGFIQKCARKETPALSLYQAKLWDRSRLSLNRFNILPCYSNQILGIKAGSPLLPWEPISTQLSVHALKSNLEISIYNYTWGHVIAIRLSREKQVPAGPHL